MLLTGCLLAVAVAQTVQSVEIPEAARPSFTQESVSWKGANGFTLLGTFLAPTAENGKKTKHPAVMLLPGSGPTDGNGNQPAFKTDLLKQLAEALSSQGVATLRFDKRACGVYARYWPPKPADWASFFSWENHVTDLKAGFKFMKSRPEVDGSRCAILGHSEGGMFALDTSAALKPFALVLIGTPGRTLEQVLETQIRSALKRQNATKEISRDILTANTAILRTIKTTGILPADVPPGLRPLYSASTVKYIQSMAQVEPTSLAAAYRGPVLVVNGELDIQVDPAKDADTLMAAFELRKSGIQEKYIVPSASHNLKIVQKPSDAGFVGPIAPAARDKVVAWLKAIFTRK